MRMYDIISDKKYGKELSEEQISFFVQGYAKGEIPDYQVSALMMAIYFNGMTDRETAILTMEMARSGKMVDLSAIEGIKCDKHSTGGVGDKTTIIITPIVAACGVKCAKMSGRGLGHTGGTVDKLEAIPGFCTTLSNEQFIKNVNEVGVSVIGQSEGMVPADKKMYALRDVTATIDSIPLIASSIMSKKIAAGADCIMLDVKCGSGAFMKTVEESRKLAQAMVKIGNNVGRRTRALITDMDIPLGYMIGNTSELREAIDVLKGGGPKDLYDVCIELAANIIFMAQGGKIEACRDKARDAITSGKALLKLRELIAAQGGDVSVIDDYSKIPLGKYQKEVICKKDGYISHMMTEKIGTSSVILGAGRKQKGEAIDHTAAIELKKKTGDFVRCGEVLAVLYTSDESKLCDAEICFEEALEFSNDKPKTYPLIIDLVTE